MRPSRSQTLLQVADLFALRSTCPRLAVGAVIAREGRILTTGYNGTPAGLHHCKHGGGPDDRCDGGAIHAEKNAIAFAAKYGFATDGSELFVTHSPCFDCAQLIIQAGIVRVYYGVEFRSLEGLDLLERAGIETHYGPEM